MNCMFIAEERIEKYIPRKKCATNHIDAVDNDFVAVSKHSADEPLLPHVGAVHNLNLESKSMNENFKAAQST